MKNLLLCVALLLLSLNIKAQKANDALLLDMYQNQRYKEAVEYLKSVYTEPITDIKVLSRFAYTYQMAGKLPDALSYYQRMYNIDSTNVPTLFNLANINLNRDNSTAALSYFRKIIAIDSLNFTVNKQVGRLYGFKGDTVNCLKHLYKANTINPDEQEVASELSNYLIYQNKYPDADKILRRALAADTTNILLYRSLMKLNYAMSKFAETVKIGKTLLRLGDVSADIYNKMGSSYFELKSYECCIESFGLLPDLFQTERTYYLTAMSFKKLKDFPKALDYLDLTLMQSISSNTWAYYSEIAGIQQNTHQLKTAASNYQKSLFFKEKPNTLYTLAILYDEDLKDKKNALKYYKAYLNSRPPVKDKGYIAYVQSRVKTLAGM